MVLFTLSKLYSFNPTKWPHKNLEYLKPGQMVTNLWCSEGKPPHNPEEGTAVIKARLLGGDMKGVDELVILGNDTMKASVVSWKKDWLGKYTIELDFNTLFNNGLEYSLRDMMGKGSGIIGFTAQDKKSLRSFTGQRELLALLLDRILPSRKQEILDLAIPALRLKFFEGDKKANSYFVGYPKGDEGETVPVTDEGIPLFHLASLDVEELPEVMSEYPVKKYLSFYIKVLESDEGWPEKSDEFKVMNHSSQTELEVPDHTEIDEAVRFGTEPLLDIPQPDHVCLQAANFTDEETEQYYMLNESYRSLIDGIEGYGWSKLLGYPDSVQNCVAHDAELFRSNHDLSDAVLRRAVQWKLLLQIVPNEEKMSFFRQFGDGTIYYLIKEDALKKGDFSDVQVVVQNT